MGNVMTSIDSAYLLSIRQDLVCQTNVPAKYISKRAKVYPNFNLRRRLSLRHSNTVCNRLATNRLGAMIIVTMNTSMLLLTTDHTDAPMAASVAFKLF